MIQYRGLHTRAGLRAIHYHIIIMRNPLRSNLGNYSGLYVTETEAGLRIPDSGVVEFRSLRL